MARSGTGKTQVLLIEDNPADVFLFRYALDTHDVCYDLSVLTDGGVAMRWVQHAEDDSRELPDLFVLDLNLPVYSGLEILAAMRRSPRLAQAPAVILTTSDGTRDREQARALGAVLYLRKPTNLDDFAALGAPLKELIEKGRPETNHRA